MKTHLFTLLMLACLTLNTPVSADFFSSCDKGKENPVATAMAEKITATIKNLPEEGANIKQIELIDGIRAMDGEIASVGEIKILVNLDWQAIANHPAQRKALDNTAARVLNAVFSEHSDITKIRVIVKIANDKGKYQSAAKVFSYTRALWVLTKNNPLYDLNTPTGASKLLALGDYVILSDKGWVRGY